MWRCLLRTDDSGTRPSGEVAYSLCCLGEGHQALREKPPQPLLLPPQLPWERSTENFSPAVPGVPHRLLGSLQKTKKSAFVPLSPSHPFGLAICWFFF